MVIHPTFSDQNFQETAYGRPEEALTVTSLAPGKPLSKSKIRYPAFSPDAREVPLSEMGARTDRVAEADWKEAHQARARMRAMVVFRFVCMGVPLFDRRRGKALRLHRRARNRRTFRRIFRRDGRFQHEHVGASGLQVFRRYRRANRGVAGFHGRPEFRRVADGSGDALAFRLLCRIRNERAGRRIAA